MEKGFAYQESCYYSAKIVVLILCSYILTHCILVDFSTVICWMSPFVLVGMLGLFSSFYSIFHGKSF